jgi:hypothetical protein
MNPHRPHNHGQAGRMAEEQRKARARREWTPPTPMKLVETPIGSVWKFAPPNERHGALDVAESGTDRATITGTASDQHDCPSEDR